MVVKFRKSLVVSKQAAQKFDLEIFNLRKISEIKIMQECQINISNRSEDLDNSNDSEDINRASKSTKENIKTSAKESLGLYELKQHKSLYDEECLGFLDQRKQAKMQWLQDPSQSNVDNINTVGREASRHFRGKKKKEYLKTKI